MKKIILIISFLFFPLFSFAQRVRVGIDVDDEAPPAITIEGVLFLLVFALVVYLFSHYISPLIDSFFDRGKRVYERVAIAGESNDSLKEGLKIAKKEKRNGLTIPYLDDHYGVEGYYFNLSGFFVIKRKVGRFYLMEGETELYGWIEVYARKRDLTKCQERKYVQDADELKNTF